MGCLFALLAGFSRGWRCSWSGWLDRYWSAPLLARDFPLLGIIFLPFATPMYVILYTAGLGLTGLEWFWVILAAFFDIGHLAASVARRRELMRSAQRA